MLYSRGCCVNVVFFIIKFSSNEWKCVGNRVRFGVFAVWWISMYFYQTAHLKLSNQTANHASHRTNFQFLCLQATSRSPAPTGVAWFRSRSIESLWKCNDQEPIQSNSTSCPRHLTGKEHTIETTYNINSTSGKTRGQLFPNRWPSGYPK